jgi:hypothetical protein
VTTLDNEPTFSHALHLGDETVTVTVAHGILTLHVTVARPMTLQPEDARRLMDLLQSGLRAQMRMHPGRVPAAEAASNSARARGVTTTHAGPKRGMYDVRHHDSYCTTAERQ